MTTKIKWRLKQLPTVGELALLVHDGILTKEQAQEVLFSLETDEDRDKQSLQDEIKFLRELVESLSKNKPERIVETIRYIEKPYVTAPWYHPYYVYANSTTGNSGGLYVTTSGTAGLATTSTMNLSSTASSLNSGLTSQQIVANGNPNALTPTGNFTSIKTF